jgi:hypothetical protein
MLPISHAFGGEHRPRSGGPCAQNLGDHMVLTFNECRVCTYKSIDLEDELHGVYFSNFKKFKF